jgi:dolichyl-phosphate-mannose-protein mannosyltransferase
VLSSSIQRKLTTLVILACVVVAIFRVITVDKTMPQRFDEPCHVAAGMEWLENRTYRLDPIHPPLERYAITLPLYLAGERFPKFSAQDPRTNDPFLASEVGPTEVTALARCTLVGNAILYGGGHYKRNLLLARLGILPFLGLCTILVFWWTSRCFGLLAACIAAFLFSTLPSILAFSSMAYTDLPTACTQFAFLFAFSIWLERPSMRHTVWLGVAAGLAFSSKMTSFLFLPCAALAMLIVRWWLSVEGYRDITAKRVWRLAAAVGLGFVILWGSYGFSIGHLRYPPAVSPASAQSLHPSSSLLRVVARKVVTANPIVPAPEFFHGVLVAGTLPTTSSYLLGNMKPGGWWYFFPVAVALKTPLSLLVLAIVGLLHAVRSAHEERWVRLMPPVAILAVFIATLFVTYKVGTRHVLVVLPLLSVLAGGGAFLLWRLEGRNRVWARLALGLLLAWHAIASVRAQNDFLAYFNELAPSDPSRALVMGCDLDCGQDLLRLNQELRARHVTHVSLGVWTSADIAQLGFPAVDVLQPYEPVTGWVAVSARSLRTGNVTRWQNGHFLHAPYYPRDALSWIEQYKPVAHVGKTILLYYIPPTSAEAATPR